MSTNGILLGQNNITNNNLYIKEEVNYTHEVGSFKETLSCDWTYGDAGNDYFIYYYNDRLYRNRISNKAFLNSNSAMDITFNSSVSCYGIFFIKPNIWIYCSQSSISNSNYDFSFYYSIDNGLSWTYKIIKDVFNSKVRGQDLGYGQHYTHNNLAIVTKISSYRETEQIFTMNKNFNIFTKYSSALTDSANRYSANGYSSPITYLYPYSGSEKRLENYVDAYSADTAFLARDDSNYWKILNYSLEVIDSYYNPGSYGVAGPYIFIYKDSYIYTYKNARKISTYKSNSFVEGKPEGIFYQNDNLTWGNDLCIFKKYITYKEKKIQCKMYYKDILLQTFNIN